MWCEEGREGKGNMPANLYSQGLPAAEVVAKALFCSSMNLFKMFCPSTPGQGKLIHSDYSQGGGKKRCTCTHTKEAQLQPK